MRAVISGSGFVGSSESGLAGSMLVAMDWALLGGVKVALLGAPWLWWVGLGCYGGVTSCA